MYQPSAKTEYASLAMLQLAAQYELGEPVCMRAIAYAHGIPFQFLAQILQQLKSAGLVHSIRGPGGGYCLSRPPDEITLGDVLSAIEGQKTSRPECTGSDKLLASTLCETWQSVAQAGQQILDTTTLGSLVDRANCQTADMYYI